jgi:hypothetical protein
VIFLLSKHHHHHHLGQYHRTLAVIPRDFDRVKVNLIRFLDYYEEAVWINY